MPVEMMMGRVASEAVGSSSLYPLVQTVACVIDHARATWGRSEDGTVRAAYTHTVETLRARYLAYIPGSR